MHLNIFIVFLFTLFAGGHSIKCYQCVNAIDSCSGTETTCPTDFTTCASATTLTTLGNTASTIIAKSCYMPQYCANGSINLGLYRAEEFMQCCNTDLCNSKDVPASSSNSANGKQCYYCNETSCLNKLNCLGTEDYCITAKAANLTVLTSLPSTVKGCVSKSVCDVISQVPQGFVNYTCCQGNLCNSAISITQSLHFFLWLFIFYIMFY